MATLGRGIIKGFRGPQVHLQGLDMRVRCSNRGQEECVEEPSDMVLSITVWAIVSPAR